MAIINGTPGNDLLTGDQSGIPENDEIFGFAGNDTLNGLGGNDTLDGGTGNDSMAGGTGDDTYVVDSVSDAVVENPGEGIDTVLTTLIVVLARRQRRERHLHRRRQLQRHRQRPQQPAPERRGQRLPERPRRRRHHGGRRGQRHLHRRLHRRRGDRAVGRGHRSDLCSPLLATRSPIMSRCSFPTFFGKLHRHRQLPRHHRRRPRRQRHPSLGLAGNDTLERYARATTRSRRCGQRQLMGSMGDDFLDGGTGRDISVFAVARSDT